MTARGDLSVCEYSGNFRMEGSCVQTIKNEELEKENRRTPLWVVFPAYLGIPRNCLCQCSAQVQDHIDKISQFTHRYRSTNQGLENYKM